MKKYIFITTAILFFILFASCSGSKSSKCESNCFKVYEDKGFGGKRYEIVTYEDSVKMKRYTIIVIDMVYGGGCTLIDTEDIK